MKKSNVIKLVLVSAIAAGCSSKEEARRCIDKNTNKVVEDRFCSAPPSSGGGMSYVPFIWYYGGGGGYSPGSVVSGGTHTPTPGYRSYSPTVRGGFGSSSRPVVT